MSLRKFTWVQGHWVSPIDTDDVVLEFYFFDTNMHNVVHVCVRSEAVIE